MVRTARQKSKTNASFTMQSPTRDNEIQQKLKKVRVCSRGCFVRGRLTKERRTQLFLVKILEEKSL